MRAKTTDLFQDAFKKASKGHLDTKAFLEVYENRMANITEQIAQLKREYQQLDDEHTAICVIFGANRK